MKTKTNFCCARSRPACLPVCRLGHCGRVRSRIQATSALCSRLDAVPARLIERIIRFAKKSNVTKKFTHLKIYCRSEFDKDEFAKIWKKMKKCVFSKEVRFLIQYLLRSRLPYRYQKGIQKNFVKAGVCCQFYWTSFNWFMVVLYSILAQSSQEKQKEN